MDVLYPFVGRLLVSFEQCFSVYGFCTSFLLLWKINDRAVSYSICSVLFNGNILYGRRWSDPRGSNVYGYLIKKPNMNVCMVSFHGLISTLVVLFQYGHHYVLLLGVSVCSFCSWFSFTELDGILSQSSVLVLWVLWFFSSVIHVRKKSFFMLPMLI